jgi:hypothetical protein
MADDDILARNNVVLSDPQSALVGGPRTYNPAMGMLLIRNPDAAAALLDSRGAPVPPDASPNITHRDAAQGLGAALDPANIGTPQTSSMMLPPTGPATPAIKPIVEPYYPPEQPSGGLTLPPEGLHLPPEPSYYRSSQDVSGPTPSPESVNSGGAVPAPATSEKPGDLSKPDPVAPAGMRMTHGPDASAPVHPDKTVDGLAKALAGLQGMTPKPFLPSTPAPYRASGQIARGTLPQALLAEMMGAAKPANQFRLGEALKGRSYA